MIEQHQGNNILATYNLGRSIHYIAQLYRVSDCIIRNYLIENGIQIRTNKLIIKPDAKLEMSYKTTKIFTESIRKEIIELFPLKYISEVVLVEKYREKIQHISSDKILYLCVDTGDKKILKVGQSTNFKNRIQKYKTRKPANGPVMIVLFETNSFHDMDKYEREIRELLESMGHILPWDNTNNRLNKFNLK